jgi:hypothetical protein
VCPIWSVIINTDQTQIYSVPLPAPYLISPYYPLKVPKRENFSLAFIALSEPVWVCDLGTGEKNRNFYQLTPDFDSFWFFAAH